MLTREHGIADYDPRTGRVLPDRLTTKSHGHYVGYANRMLDVYRRGIDRTRRELHRSVQAIFDAEPDCPIRRINAFCKLLDDAGLYQRGTRRQAAELRRTVLRMAAKMHPLVSKPDRLFEHSEGKAKAEIAARLGRPWSEINRELFADVFEFHRLARFDGFADGRALLSRYNVAQVQVALFDAVSMTVWAADDFKTILRYAKLAGLMHSITRTSNGRYQLRFDGPASLLRTTRRYGAAMAQFLPSLIACRNWRMHAVLDRRHRRASLDFCSADGLTSHLPTPERFDSHVEQSFAEKWGAEPRHGWHLVREGEILHRGQKVFVPDFVFRHEDGRSVVMEIVGFWTPEYLAAKVRTLQEFRNQEILLAVAHSLTDDIPDLVHDAVIYKSAIHIKEVLGRLNGRE